MGFLSMPVGSGGVCFIDGHLNLPALQFTKGGAAMMHSSRPGESQAVSQRLRLTLSTLLLVGSLVGATAASAASFFSLTDLGSLGGGV